MIGGVVNALCEATVGLRLRVGVKMVLAAIVATLATAEASYSADGKLLLNVFDAKTHEPLACRMHLLGQGKRPKKIETFPFWSDHVVFPGKIQLNLPAGFYTFEIERGPEYYNVMGNFTIERFADDTKDVAMRRVVDMSQEGWWSGDLYVRRPARDVELLVSADDLHVAQAVTWWNDKNDLSGKNLKLPKNRLVTFDRNRAYELYCGGFTRAGTEVLCFHTQVPLLLQGQAGEFPSLVKHLATLRKQENSELWIDATASYGWDLPVLAANGLLDSVEVANGHFGRKAMQIDSKVGKPFDSGQYAGGSGYARWTHDVYFKLLDCGLRLPPTAGSGSGISPNPVGYNRVYVHLDGSFDYNKWWKNLKAGQVVVTNGPLMRATVDGELPGHTFHGEEGKELNLQIGMTLTTRDPISYLDIIQDGRVHESIRFDQYVKDGKLPPLKFTKSGWFILRAVADISDTYRFAMTGPFYVEFGEKPRIGKKSAQFFLDWVYERAKQIQLNDPTQQAEVMEWHRKARDYWKDIVEKANAE